MCVAYRRGAERARLAKYKKRCRGGRESEREGARGREREGERGRERER